MFIKMIGRSITLNKLKELIQAVKNQSICEKPLEGKIEQDVEHFRPKAEVRPWKPSKQLEQGGVMPA